jgi:succinylarginine dihydrolase
MNAAAAPSIEFREYNFDGLVGPTHHYGGLSRGNPASMQNRALVSHPRLAVRQGLAKMRCLFELGVGQALIPPLHRPRLDLLRRVGFTGNDQQIIEKAWRQAPDLLSASFSASGMWTANAATVAPSCDTADSKLHFTPANLIANLHRSFEAEETAALLQVLFPDPELFFHHAPLPPTLALGDEGAANHNRLVAATGNPGIQLFVYGREHFRQTKPTRFPQRQTLEAAQAIARLHRLDADRTFFAQQNPESIEAGVFHNDVIATAHNELLLYHEKAFFEPQELIQQLSTAFAKTQGRDLFAIEINQFSLSEAVASYFFNSQVVTAWDGKMVLIAPEESRQIAAVYETIQQLQSDPNCPISRVLFLDLRESMKNGGGPACLRNRIVLNSKERAAVPQRVFLDEHLFSELEQWADRRYRESLILNDFLDPSLREEVELALDELTQVLGLGSIYAFQKGGA